MTLVSFLEVIRPKAMASVAEARDDVGKIYAPKTYSDSAKKEDAKRIARVLGVEGMDFQEVWLTVWSRKRSEVEPIVPTLKANAAWKLVSEERDEFQHTSLPVTMNVGGDGTVTLIKRVSSQQATLNSEEFGSALGDIWTCIVTVLTHLKVATKAKRPARRGALPAHDADEGSTPPPEKAGAHKGENADDVLARIAVEQSYATQEQVDEARDLQRKAREIGLPRTLGEMLKDKGYLTVDTFQELMAATAVATGEARIVAGYEVVEKLGQGGMGAVYKAKKLDDGEIVALKILPPSLADDQTIARFQRESKIASKLRHDGIVRCIEFGHDARHGFHYCALEYVEGENLGQIIRSRWQIPETEAIGVIRQVATALEYANLSNLIHRDVKPENIMVTPQGDAKLLDLGLARRTAKEATRLTDSGIFVGSPYYASPEQVLGDQKIDIRSDLYSLGATFYHMVTGRPPFGGTRTFEVLQKHVSQKLPWPADVNPELSDAVCRVIAKMMAKEPRDRYQTPTELVEDLDAVLHGNDSAVDEDILRRSSVSAAVRVRRHRHRPPTVKNPVVREDSGRGRQRRRSRRDDDPRAISARKKSNLGGQVLIAFLVAAAATAATVTVMLLMGK